VCVCVCVCVCVMVAQVINARDDNAKVRVQSQSVLLLAHSIEAQLILCARFVYFVALFFMREQRRRQQTCSLVCAAVQDKRGSRWRRIKSTTSRDIFNHLLRHHHHHHMLFTWHATSCNCFAAPALEPGQPRALRDRSGAAPQNRKTTCERAADQPKSDTLIRSSNNNNNNSFRRRHDDKCRNPGGGFT